MGILIHDKEDSMRQMEPDLEQPKVILKSPSGLVDSYNWSLDEYYHSNPNLEVEEILHNETEGRIGTLSDAVRARRTRSKPFRPCYRVYCSSDQGFFKKIQATIGIPKLVRDNDIYTSYWPAKKFSKFLKARSYMLYEFPSNYQSGPRVAYAGMSEWMKVFSGRIVITLIKPTEANMSRVDSFVQGHAFEPVAGTFQVRELQAGHFILIPSGYITVINSKRPSCVLAGEYLSKKSIGLQLEYFQRDVLNNRNMYLTERDTEIRTMYWIFASKLLDNHDSKKLLHSYKRETVTCLRDHLRRWQNLDSSSKRFLSSTAFRPSGLKVDLITRDLQNYINGKFCAPKNPSRKSFQNVKNSSDILAIQAPAHNHAD